MTPAFWGIVSPVEPPPLAVRIIGSGTTRGVIWTSLVALKRRSSLTRWNGSVALTVSGPVRNLPRIRPAMGYEISRRHSPAKRCTVNLGTAQATGYVVLELQQPCRQTGRTS